MEHNFEEEPILNINNKNNENLKLKVHKIYGNSTQKTREGYNLLPILKFANGDTTQTLNGITATILENGKIHIQGTATNRTVFYLNHSYHIELLNDNVYSMQSNGILGEFWFEFQINENQETMYLTTYNGENRILKQKGDEVSVDNYYIIINNGKSVNIDLYMMIFEGSSNDKPYEPYGVMPSPEFPSEVECVKPTRIKDTGKNLFNINELKKIENPDIEVNEDGSISIKQANYISSNITLKELAPLLKIGNTYVLNFDSNGEKFIFLTLYNKTWQANSELTITQQILDSIVIFYGNRAENKGATITNFSIVPKEISNLPYEPYKETITPIDLKGNELCKIGDTRDKLVVSKGNAIINKRFTKYVFTGEEDIIYIRLDIEGWCRPYVLLSNKKIGQDNAKANVTSNKFSEGTWDTRNQEKNIVYTYSGDSRIEFNIKEDNLISLDNVGVKKYFKDQYDSGGPVYVIYELETPQTIQLDKIEGEKLNNLYLFNGTNNIELLSNIPTEIDYNTVKLVEDTDYVDFYISANGYLLIPEINARYLINLSESTIPSMPEATETVVKIAGRDGDIPLETTYEPMSFEIICYTEEGLTLQEKVENEQKLNMFLNSIKNKTKTFAIEKDNKFYKVKYVGTMTTINYPNFLQFNIPLKSSESFSKDLKENILIGNNSITSNTIKEVGAIFTIKGPAQTPKISFNDYEMFYNHSILENQELEINSINSTITLINNVNSTRTNAMRYYNHQFPKVQNGVNTLEVLSGIDDEKQVYVKWYDLKL